MKRPFAVLGGSAFLSLALAACAGTAAARTLAPVCAGLGFCTLFGALFSSKKLSSLRASRAFSVFTAVFLTAAVCLSSYGLVWDRRAAPAEELDGAEALIRGTVLDYPEESNGRAYYLVEVRRAVVEGKIWEGPAFTVRLSTTSPFAGEPGDALECTVKFYAFDGSGGLYSPKNSYLAKGVETGGYVSDYGGVTVIPSGGASPDEMFARLRHLLGRNFERRLPSEEAGLARAVLLGEKERVPDDVYYDFKSIGATHLLVVSGMHMAALMGLFSAALGSLRLRRRLTSLLTGLCVLGFLCLIGFSPSATRSGVMYLLLLSAGCFGGRPDGVNSLGAAVLVICLANPFSGGDLGFALSVFSTLGILLLGNTLSRALLRPFRKAPRLQKALRPVAGSLAATFSAMLFTLPIQITVFRGLSLLAPAAALLLVYPCAALLYASALASFLGLLPWLSPLAEPFYLLAGWTARLMEKLAGILAQAPGAFLDLTDPVNAALTVASAAALATALFAWTRRADKLVAGLAVSAALLLCCCGKGAQWAAGRGVVTLAATADASCVAAMRDGEAAVLSLGGSDVWAAGDLLRRNNIRRVTVLCVPSEDASVRAAAREVLGSFRVETLALPEDAALGRELTLAGARCQRFYAGEDDVIELLDGVEASVSREMARLTIAANGTDVIVETGETGPGRCRLLFTTAEKSKIDSSFTILQKDDILWEDVETVLAEASPGRYLLPAGEGLYADLFPDGSVRFRGETRGGNQGD